MTAVLLLLVAAATSDTTAPAPGTPIVAIQVVRDDIFDITLPATSSWPYRWANHLHVLTRERYVRSLLLFKVGDPLDPALIAESERLLRSTGFLSPVTITVRAAPGGAEVVVHTHDQWTTLVGVNFGLAGNRTKYGASLSEKNLLGWGKLLDFEYASDPERTSTTFEYRDNLFLGSRWQLNLEHKNASDGKTEAAGLQYPFFSLATPRAGGVTWVTDTKTEYLYASNKTAVSGTAKTESFLAWSGVRLPGSEVTTNRLTLGIFTDFSEFSSWVQADGTPYPNLEGHDMRGIQVGWDHQLDRWQVVRGFRTWQRQEDVPLGPNWTVTSGFSLPAFGGDQSRVKLDAIFTLGHLMGRQYSWLNVGESGRIESGGVDNQVCHIDFGTARSGSVGWRGRVAVDLGHNLDGDRQLTLGADTGLRGWNPDTFDGTSRAVANVEWRHVLTGEVLHLAIIGGTVFVDAGKTWAPRVGPDTEGIRKDAGVGLLIESTRASTVTIIRIEAAFPDRGKGPVFLISSSSLF
jgi:outer membrane protein assembly factor BamA